MYEESSDFWNYTILVLGAIGGIMTIMQAQIDGKQSIEGIVIGIVTALLTAWVMFHNTRMNTSDKMATVLPEIGTVITAGLVLHGALKNK